MLAVIESQIKSPAGLTLVSHALCPYVQRAVIALREKGVAFRRVDIDLAAKPGWFGAISPLGRVPLLRVGDAVIFESAVIVEYLEETQPRPLHPADPLERAEHRSWIEFGSAVLADIAGLYTAPDKASFERKVLTLRERFARLEIRLGDGPWFAGGQFGLVDAAFAPVFRYFDAFDRIGAFGILDGQVALARWRSILGTRRSVQDAVGQDYAERLLVFLRTRGSHLSTLMA